MVNDFDYEVMEFLVLKKLVARLNRRIIFASMNFVMKMVLLILPMYHIKNFKDCMHLLLITDENKSQYLYIKHFNRFMCNKTKNKNKKHFCKYCLQCFTSERILIEHKEPCLKINSKQIVK